MGLVASQAAEQRQRPVTATDRADAWSRLPACQVPGLRRGTDDVMGSAPASGNITIKPA